MCLYVCGWVGTHMTLYVPVGRENLWESFLFFYHVSSKDLNSDYQAWRQAPLTAESSLWPLFIFLVPFTYIYISVCAHMCMSAPAHTTCSHVEVRGQLGWVPGNWEYQLSLGSCASWHIRCLMRETAVRLQLGCSCYIRSKGASHFTCTKVESTPLKDPPPLLWFCTTPLWAFLDHRKKCLKRKVWSTMTW